MSGPLIIPWQGKVPQIAPDAFVAPNATLIGDVVIGPQASVWFNCVLRGDNNMIRIGARSNIQESCVIHADPGPNAAIIGDDVLVGHKAMIHGAKLESGAFVGMCATLLDGVVIESEGMVGACGLLTPNKRVKKGELWAGTPARFVRAVREEELAGIKRGVAHYVERAAAMRAELARMGK